MTDLPDRRILSYVGGVRCSCSFDDHLYLSSEPTNLCRVNGRTYAAQVCTECHRVVRWTRSPRLMTRRLVRLPPRPRLRLVKSA